MLSSFESAKFWLYRTARENRAVQGQASLESLRRFRIFAAVTLLINLVYLLSYWHVIADASDMIRSRHAFAIVLTHTGMAIAMLLLGLLAHWLYRSQRANSTMAIILQILICLCSFAFAIAITIIDQPITESMTTFVLINLLIAMLSLMRPAISLPLFALSYIVFFATVAYSQNTPEVISRLQANGRDILVVSVAISILIWRQYVASILLHREIMRAHHALADKQHELTFLATHDSLTGLFNRREFMRQSEMELVRARRNSSPTHIIMLDLDNFKAINDRYGHPEGDLVLTKTAMALTGSVRETDLVARLGGEEFIILLPQTTKEAALKVAEKLRMRIQSTRHEAEGDEITFCASFGVAGLSVGQAALLDDVYTAADQALYQAKRLGRNRVEFAATNFVNLPPQFVRGDLPA